MNCLTLYDPHAWLVSLSQKKIETRCWSTNVRGDIGIHVAKSTDWLGLATKEPFRSALRPGGQAYLPQRHLGCIVCVVRLIACIPIDREPKRWSFGKMELVIPPAEPERSFGDYSTDPDQRYAFVLADVRRLKRPIPASGSRKFWTYPDAEIYRVGFAT